MLRRLWTALATHLHRESVVMASPFHIVRDSASPRCTSTVHLETMFPRWSFWWITQIRLKPDMKHLENTPVILKCSRLYQVPYTFSAKKQFIFHGGGRMHPAGKALLRSGFTSRRGKGHRDISDNLAADL